MGIQPTFIDRSMTNKRVLDLANTFMYGLNSLQEYEKLVRKEGQNHKPKVDKLSDDTQSRAIAHIGHIFRSSTDDSIRKIIWTHKAPKDTQKGEQQDATLNIPEKFRFGRPRTCWIRIHVETIWEKYALLRGIQWQVQIGRS